jgi:hypothetical protein
MGNEGMQIEYRTPNRLLDSLKLQFRCSFYLLRYVWIFSAIILIVLLSLNAMSLWSDPWAILVPLAAGLVGGTLASPIILIVRRVFRKFPEIRADIGEESIKIIGHHGFSYEANWPNLTWVKEGSSAYVMRFNKLFVRLPKRGFVDQQETAFRSIVRTKAPASALKCKI